MLRSLLLTMLPTCKIYLDDDDMEDDEEEIEGQLDQATAVLVFLTSEYVGSRKCMHELTTARRLRKPLIVVREADSQHGGLSAKAFESEVELHLARHLKGSDHVQLSEDEQSALAWLRSEAIGGARVTQSSDSPWTIRQPHAANSHLFLACLRPAGLEWHREKQLKHAVLRSIAELIYHYTTGGDTLFGSWLSRKRASVARALRSSSRRRSSRDSSSSVQERSSFSSASSSSLGGPSSSAGVHEEASLEGYCELEKTAAATEGVEVLERTSKFSSGETSGRHSEAASSESSPSSPSLCGVCSPRPASPSLGMKPGASAKSTGVVRKSICASLTGRSQIANSATSSADGTARKRAESVQARQMRLMRLRDQFELTPEMTKSTVLYLSPYYRQLPASGVAADGDIRHNMYNELVAQFGALGVEIKGDTESAFAADQRSLMLVVLCPGFFGCPQLVEETAYALRNTHKERRNSLGGQAASADESSLQREDSIIERRNSFGAEVSERAGRFQRKPKTLVALFSTASSFDDYFQSCPPDLKELGLFESMFDKWPESPLLQSTAIKTLIHRLPGHHHATRYRAGDLLRRLGGRRGTVVEARPALTAWANVDHYANRATAPRLDRGASGRLGVRRSVARKPTTGAPSPAAPPAAETSVGPPRSSPRSLSFSAALEPRHPVATDALYDQHGAAIPLAGRNRLPLPPPDMLEALPHAAPGALQLASSATKQGEEKTRDVTPEDATLTPRTLKRMMSADL